MTLIPVLTFLVFFAGIFAAYWAFVLRPEQEVAGVARKRLRAGKAGQQGGRPAIGDSETDRGDELDRVRRRHAPPVAVTRSGAADLDPPVRVTRDRRDGDCRLGHVRALGVRSGAAVVVGGRCRRCPVERSTPSAWPSRLRLGR